MSEVNNVATGKPQLGGAIQVAPKGTALPTDAITEPAAAFKNLGYVSDSGFVNQNTATTETKKAWGGDVILNPSTEKSDIFTFTLLEILNVDVLKFCYGSTNVSGDLDTGIHIKANSKEAEEVAMVVDMVLNGALKRICIPRGKVTSIGDIAYVDGEPVGYPITLTAFPDSNGDTHHEYIINDPDTPSM